MRSLIAALLFALPAFAQTPYLVKDLNTTVATETESSNPSEFLALGSRVFFAATTDETGAELWSTDGTSASLFADIVAGAGSSNATPLAVHNGLLLFRATTAEQGAELWATDGTAAGTRLLVDINPGTGSSSPAGVFVYTNRVLFSATDGVNGRELWTTDATAAGTRMLFDIAPGSASSTPLQFVVLNGTLYFAAANRLWKTDGTESGTVRAANVLMRNPKVLGSQILFEGSSNGADYELWVSDGTEAGTRMLVDVWPGARGGLTMFSLAGFTVVGNRAIFLATHPDHGRELWVTDGTAAGTRLLRDFVPGPRGALEGTGNFPITAYRDRAYFAVADDDQSGADVWVSDGTEAGTTLFLELPASSSLGSLMTVFRDQLLFAVSTVGSLRLWRSDGTSAGTRPIGPAGSYHSALRVIGDKAYFAGSSPLAGTEPWITDGTDEGTRMIANLATDVAPSSSPNTMVAAANLLFFHASGGVSGNATWRSDGTAEGTFDIAQAEARTGIVSLGTHVLIPHPTDSNRSLVTDGTVAGTRSASELFARFDGARSALFYPFGETLFAVAGTGLGDTRLWKTAAAPNAPAVDLGVRNAGPLVEVAGRYFFFASRRGLWTTDGTRAGTYAVVPDFGDLLDITPLVNVRGTLYWLMTVRNEPSRKLWKSDGTFDGTVVVREVPGAPSFPPPLLIATNRHVFFRAVDGLWASDGTAAGTLEVAKFSPLLTRSTTLAAAGDRAVFTSTPEGNVWELWGSDGTKEGTRMLRALAANWPELGSVDDLAYFIGTDDPRGSELWVTDGTVDGTKLVADINPAAASSFPVNFTKARNRLFFSAVHDATGRELWAIPLAEATVSVRDARAGEGGNVRFTIALDAPATQAVTLAYATSDGTARAGEDYDAASGALTFAIGETAKTVDVRARADVAAENDETFFLALRDVTGARVVGGDAAGIIADDDGAADLAAAVEFSPRSLFLADLVRVTNHGPRAATDVVVTYTATPLISFGSPCSCAIPQIASGASAATDDLPSEGFVQVYSSATASARQPDPRPANNTTVWTIRRGMAMSALSLTPGQTATVFATLGQTHSIIASDPTVVSTPAAVTVINERFGSFPVTALRPGTSRVELEAGNFLDITVLAPGTAMRYPGGMGVELPTTTVAFDKPLEVTITPSGRAPVTGASATGTVTATSAGRELARVTVSGTGPVTLPIYFPALGRTSVDIAYSGDANFTPSTVTADAFVVKGRTTIAAMLHPTGVPGSFTLDVDVTGSPLAAPTGTLTILNGTTELARVPLVASGAKAEAQATLTSLPATPTLTIRYSGDAFYDAGTQQVRFTGLRRRSSR
jgi:ELWxxDGT repeat protein